MPFTQIFLHSQLVQLRALSRPSTPAARAKLKRCGNFFPVPALVTFLYVGQPYVPPYGAFSLR